MKNAQICTLVLGSLFFVLGFTVAPSAQAYDANQNAYQFSDGRQLYQVYAAPIQTQHQSQYRNPYYDQNIQSLLQQIDRLRLLLQQLQSGMMNNGYSSNVNLNAYDDAEVEVVTRLATDVRDESARLRGTVSDFNRSRYADVWFEYGQSRNALDKRTPIIRIDDDENEDFYFQVNRLRDDERYYFRAVAEDDDEERDYGTIKAFQTRDYDRDNRNNRNDDEPEVSVQRAFDVDDNSARLAGDVDMNDFRDGEVFLVYGEDEYQVDEVDNEYDSYRDIDEDGDDLRKFRLDSDLDGDSSYEVRVTGLDDNTDHYYALCVGYENQYNNDVLKCSATREFETD
jgi:hypothetical protein